MQNRNNQNASGRWGGSGQFRSENANNRYGHSNYYYPENENEGRLRGNERASGRRNQGFIEDRSQYGPYNYPDQQGFGGGDYYGGSHSYGRRDNYSGSTISGGGGGFGSPSDYGAGGSGGNYSGGYAGSSGSYGSGSNYRGGSSYAGGGNYSSGYGSAYDYNQPMPGHDDASQESYHGRTGYRSNYVSAQSEFDAVMEDPMTSSNYLPEQNSHRNNYRNYNLGDNYGSMDGRYSDYNNYTGRRDYDSRGGSRYQDGQTQDGFYRQQNEHNWLERAGNTVRNWFDNRHR